MWPRATAGCVCPAVHLPAIASATGPIDCPPRPLGLAHDSTDMTAAFPAQDDIRIAVIGLGYVGLPLAAAFGRRYPTVGFDIDAQPIAQLRDRPHPTPDLPAHTPQAPHHPQFGHPPHDPPAAPLCHPPHPTPPHP